MTGIGDWGSTSSHDIEAIRQSDLFDARWYLDRYPDVRLVGMDPAEHYLWLGARLNRDPSPKFSTVAYLSANADVAAAGANPLLHYIRGGMDGFSHPPVTPHNGSPVLLDGHSGGHDQRAFEAYGEYVSRLEGNVYSISPSGDLERPQSWSGTLGVHLHLFYPEMAWKFFSYLKNVPVEFDLYISICHDGSLQAIESTFSKLPKCKNLQIRRFPNRGRDIAPMLAGFGKELQKIRSLVPPPFEKELA